MDKSEVSSVEAELAELEELIQLQRRKVALLQRKNEFIASQSTNNESVNSQSDVSDHNNSADALRAASAAGPFIESSTKAPFDYSELKKDSSTSEKAEEKSTNKDDGKDSDSGKEIKVVDISKGASSSKRSRRAGGSLRYIAKTLSGQLTSPEEEQKEMLSAIQRMSRLTSDLANERNLLAWGRTALAACRTALAFLGISGISLYGNVSSKTCTIAFAVLAFWMMNQGLLRYNRIKEILSVPNPPAQFNRLSNVPMNVVLIVFLLLVVVSLSSQQWTKN